MFADTQYPNIKKEIYTRNNIHSTAIIGDDVEMGHGNYVGPYCVISGKTIIGDLNRFEGYCSIGSFPEHLDFKLVTGKTWIGDGCWFREFVTVNSGTTEITTLRDNVIMLRGSYVGHDSYIGDNVTLSCNVAIGGKSHVFEGANFGLAAVCHQYSVIGHYSMVGMNGTIVKKSVIMPGYIYAGNPVRMIGLNEVGLKRGNVTNEQLETFNHQFNLMCNPE